ncbi:MAG: hypothetical protein QXP02_00190 [Desulfurococcaceae archaeon]
MISDVDYPLEDREEVEETEEITEEEKAEEIAEIIIDQLKVLLDVTKLWRKILKNEINLESLESLVKPSTAPVLVTVEKPSPRKRSSRERKKFSKTRRKRS